MAKNSWKLLFLSFLFFGKCFSSGAVKYKKQGKFLFREKIQNLRCFESIEQKSSNKDLNKEYTITKKNPEKKRQRKISFFEGKDEEFKIHCKKIEVSEETHGNLQGKNKNLEFVNKQENIINYKNFQNIADKINTIFFHKNDFYEDQFYTLLEQKIYNFLNVLFEKRQEGENLQEQCNTLTSQLLLNDNHFFQEFYNFFSPEDIQKDSSAKHYLGRLSFDIVQTSRNFLMTFEGAILNLENKK